MTRRLGTHGRKQPRPAVRMLRLRQAGLLARPLARSVVWLPLPAGAALGLALLSLDHMVVLELRLAAISLCVGAAFVLDDAAHDSLAASPSPLLFRRLLRISLLLPPVAALWAMMLSRAGEGFGAALTLELAAMLALTLAIAAAAAPLSPDGRGGVAAAAGLLLTLGAAALLLPDAWTLFPFGPEDPRWDASHARWGAVLAGAALLVVLASRDPAARALLARRPPRAPERGGAQAVPEDKRMPPAQPGSECRGRGQPFPTSISSTWTQLPVGPRGRGSQARQARTREADGA